ncbi:bacteriophage abortive infection AbiH family protein [Paraeggerthella sp. Marseille-Q4926]|uniref:bacteriophage abortive infection AbiH family protein n=1 Tax=Paraeggerthella sp. Marseille-Q4926 TaxID=2866587 RepID=UPI001CE4598F|nr:bacteriophage abortive infection AbiH family protein [Paraeggerthella sp. Marseille-Q4926]
MEPARLYVVGNGFDLHYRIKSGYCDFGSYVKARDSAMHESLGFLSSDFTWGDFENELGGLGDVDLNDLAKNYGAAGPDEDVAFGLERDLVAYDSVRLTVENALRSRELFELFDEWIRGIEFPDPFPCDGLVADSEEALYLTFNYTETIEKFFGVDPQRVLHIHGSRLGKDALVFGHNRALDCTDSWCQSLTDYHALDESLSHVRGFLAETRKPVDRIIRGNREFFDGLKPVSEIIVIGLSWSSVDSRYFELIRDGVAANARWGVYMYGSDKERSNIARKIDAIIGPNWDRLEYPETV